MRTRRSVERDVREFAGWEHLIELAGRLEGEFRAVFAAAFLTGGRITEVLALARENFVVTENLVRVRKMPLIKRYKKTEEQIKWVQKRPDNVLRRLYHWDEGKQMWYRRCYKTEKKDETRAEFAFPRTEPLAPILTRWVEGREGRLFTPSRFKVWRKFNEIGIYPHWLRAQRASCLIAFYGWSMEDMMEWMGWEELSTAQRYGKMGWRKLAGKFDGVPIPSKAKEMEKLLITDG